nr:hypothetical protein [Tanacetum cinerariifolium]
MLFYLIMNLYVPFGIPFDPKRYYKDGIYTRMLQRPRYGTLTTTLERIHDRDMHRVRVVDFQGLLELMRDVLDAMMRMEHCDDGGVVVFTSRARRRLFDIRGPLVKELILEFLSILRFAESESERMILGKGDLRDYWRSISTDEDFLGPPPSYTLIRDLVLRLCHRMMTHNIAGTTATTTCYRTMPQRMARLEEDVYEIRVALTEQHEVIGAMAMDFSKFTVWAFSDIEQLLDSAQTTCTPYFETHIPYERHRFRQRTVEASTFTAQQEHDT